jgi:hypothetical protein
MVDISGGTFTTERYHTYADEGQVGATMVAIFKPNAVRGKQIDAVNEWHFHLIQIVRDTVAGVGLGAQGNVGFRDRSVPGGNSAGWGVDMEWMAKTDDAYRSILAARSGYLTNRVGALPALILAGDPTGSLAAELAALQAQLGLDAFKVSANGRAKSTAITSLDPRYAQQRIAEAVPLFSAKAAQTGGNALVLRSPYTVGIDARATLRDNPNVPVGSDLIGMEFEIAVLFEYGPAGGRLSRYLGSVSWGWTRTNGRSDVVLAPLAQVSNAGVSQAYTDSVNHWNGLTVGDPRNGGNPVAVMTIPAQ